MVPKCLIFRNENPKDILYVHCENNRPRHNLFYYTNTIIIIKYKKNVFVVEIKAS